MDQALARPVQTAAGFAGQPLLSVENLSVTYGAVQAVRDLDLVIGAGEIVTLLGANGAGKSSTLKAIVGLAPRSRGRIQFGARDIGALPTEAIVRAGIALVPEGRRLFQNMTVRENLRLGASALRADQFETDVRQVLRPVPGDREALARAGRPAVRRRAAAGGDRAGAS